MDKIVTVLCDCYDAHHLERPVKMIARYSYFLDSILHMKGIMSREIEWEYTHEPQKTICNYY